MKTHLSFHFHPPFGHLAEHSKWFFYIIQRSHTHCQITKVKNKTKIITVTVKNKQKTLINLCVGASSDSI